MASSVNEEGPEHDEYYDDAPDLSTSLEQTIITQAAHQSGFGEAVARGTAVGVGGGVGSAATTNHLHHTFVPPFPEETTFLEPEMHDITAAAIAAPISSSPHSMDSWLNYDSTSSEDYSYSGSRYIPNFPISKSHRRTQKNQHNHHHNHSSHSSSGLDHHNKKANKINKRSCKHRNVASTSNLNQVLAKNNDDDDIVNSISEGNKRARTYQENKVPNNSRRTSHSNGPGGLTEVRMIDFAHTAFVLQNGGFSISPISQSQPVSIFFSQKFQDY